MHTPTHAVVALALFDRRASARLFPALVGAILPDLPAMGFYAYYRFVGRLSESAIWGDLYQRPIWQAALAPFHSIPIALVVLAAGAARRSATATVLGASLLLHDLLDLPLHGEDAHRHLWPLSDARFVSPLSYWDRAHHAALVAPVEVALEIGGAWLLFRRHRSPWLRGALALAALGMTVAWATGRLFWST
jgi:hypothetical protein